MKHLNGKVAAITGAGSGIGRALSLELVARGCAVALADVDGDGLRETAEHVQQLGGKASTHRVDVSQAEAVQGFADAAIEAHGAVQILINNAGITFGGTFLEHDMTTWQRIIDVNLMGVVAGCYAFLPHMLGLPEAHIVNLSSVCGLIGMPSQSAYCASKFAVRGFTESLWLELADTQVGLTVVHPGGVATQIVDNSEFANPELKAHVSSLFQRRMMPPERAAKQIVRAIQRNRKSLAISAEAHAVSLLKRMMPVYASSLIAMTMERMLGLQPFAEQARITPLAGSTDPSSDAPVESPSS